MRWYSEETKQVKELFIKLIKSGNINNNSYSWDELIDICLKNGIKIIDDGYIQEALQLLHNEKKIIFEHGAIIKIL